VIEPRGEATRDDHAELVRRRALPEDAARPEAVERRHATHGRTARENVADLIDAGSFVQYGRFAIAAQRFRRDVDDLIDTADTRALIAATLTAAEDAPQSTRARFVDTW
jgi:methylmalonyl-CoA carboxyltransferase 12S subunit